MPTAVAVEGDTQVVTSSAKLPADADQAGSWQEVSVLVITGQHLSAGGKKVELSATAPPLYSGGAVQGVALPPVPDSASLQAGSTKLTDAGNGILIDTDEVTGSVDSGNKITVSASQQILKTG